MVMGFLTQQDPSVGLLHQWTARWHTPSAPYDWKWPSRYALVLLMLCGCVLVFMWFSYGRVNEWAAIGLPAIFALWALVIGRELGLAILALTGIAIAWHFAKDFDQGTWVVFGVIGLVFGLGHIHDKSISGLRAEIQRLEDRIRQLEYPRNYD